MSSEFKKPNDGSSNRNRALRRIRSKNGIEPFSRAALLDVYHAIRTTAGSSCGPDSITFSSLSEKQWNNKITGLAKSITNNSYKPGPTRNVKIAKPSGGFRTIKIQNHIDRIPDRACFDVLTLTLEKIFVNWSFGFRPKKSTVNVFAQIRNEYSRGNNFVCHYDIEKAFDHVNVVRLRRLVDGLTGVNIQVKEMAGLLIRGNKGKRLIGLDREDDSEIGISQGQALSALLFNFYLHELHDKHMEKTLSDSSRIYRYADDFCVTGSSASEVEQTVNQSLALLKRSGFTCSGGKVLDLRTKKLDLLGLTVSGHETDVEFELSDLAWNHLDDKIDAAHMKSDPVENIKLLVRGWRQSIRPVVWNEGNQKRLDEMINAHGVTMDPFECDAGWADEL